MKIRHFFLTATGLVSLATLGLAQDKDAANPQPQASPTPKLSNVKAGKAETSPQADKQGKDTARPMVRHPITGPEFAQEAAMGGMTEVAVGKLAETNGGSPEIKAFGALMVKDHSAANEKLMAIAQAKSIKLPAALNQKHQAMVDKMAAMKGTAFDKMYVTDMVAGHEKTVTLFKNASENVTDSELKTFATETLPIIEGHLEKIKAIQASMK